MRSAAKCNPLLCSSIALTIAVKRICYLSLATISLACVLLIDYYYYRYSIVDSDIIIVLIDWKDVYYCSVISERELTYLSSVYVDDLIVQLRQTGYGIHIGQLFVGCAFYADDLSLIHI